jgi:mono/diheme cytochrome c family protein
MPPLMQLIVIRTLALALAVCWAAAALRATAGAGQQVDADAPPLTVEAATALENPIPHSSKSIARGKLLYATLGCADCHGADGKALIEIVANATDLTEPEVWKNGTEPGLVFRSIRDGAGLAMPPFKTQVTAPDDLWHLVNFIRSLWPEERRPPLVSEPG